MVKYRNISRHVCIHGLVRTSILLCQLRGTRSNDTPATMSTPGTQILVANTPLQEREHGLLAEMPAFRTGASNRQGEPRTEGLVAQEHKEVLKTTLQVLCWKTPHTCETKRLSMS